MNRNTYANLVYLWLHGKERPKPKDACGEDLGSYIHKIAWGAHLGSYVPNNTEKTLDIE